jgi:predicted GNAT family acetyltransferase
MTDPVVARSASNSRYEVTVDGQLAGFVDYVERGDAIRFTHTETLDEFRGKGLGEVVAGFAIADAVARDLRIVPVCPYIARYLRRHQVAGAVVDWPEDVE